MTRLALLVLALLLAAPARAERIYWNDELASALIGKSVLDRRGERLGEIDDLVLDLERGTASFALVESGGLLGLFAELRAFPVGWLAPGARDEAVRLDIDAAELDAAARQAPHGLRASEILGRPVRDASGREAGELRDLVVNLGDGALRHAVIMLRAPRRQVSVQPQLLAAGEDAVRVELELAELRAMVTR
jgi:sporulation protein YlmC with PRC-barrel domain